MKTKLLPSLSEAWHYYYKQDVSDYLINERYDNFINWTEQSPKLYMFVTCDEKGNVLKKPEYYDTYLGLKKEKFDITGNTKIFEQYQQALDRVIFDGFEVSETDGGIYVFDVEIKDKNGVWLGFNKDGSINNSYSSLNSLADLSGKVYLNENGIKDSGI